MELARKSNLYLCFLGLFSLLLSSCYIVFHNPFLDDSFTETSILAASQVETLAMNPIGGTFSADQSVEITCATSGATIRYTTDGTDPNGSSPVYAGAIPVAGNGTNMTIKAYATKAAMEDSAIQSELYTIQDTTAPVPGNSGTITASNVQMTSITLNWTKAADDYTPQSSLQYRVYRSASGNIDTAANATANGTLVQDWTSDIGTCPASSLTLDTLYYFNVVVRDAASPENRRAYTMISQRTAPSNVNDYEVFWKLNNLDDSSGHNHTLLNFGATSAQNRALTPNASYDLSSNLMSVYDASELNFTSGLTISLWIYVTGNPVNDQKMIARFNTANNRGYAFGIINNHLYPEVYNSLGNHFTYNDGAITLSANQWYHVTMTWKTNEYLKTYVNGTLDKSIAVNNNSIGQVSDAFFTLGSGSDGAPTFRFAGLVDDIRIYGRELSQTEVQFLANLPAD